MMPSVFMDQAQTRNIMDILDQFEKIDNILVTSNKGTDYQTFIFRELSTGKFYAIDHDADYDSIFNEEEQSYCYEVEPKEIVTTIYRRKE